MPPSGGIEGDLQKKVSTVASKMSKPLSDVLFTDYWMMHSPDIYEDSIKNRGLGNQVYSMIEKDTGKKIMPDWRLSEYSKNLHKKYGLGKKFGSEEYGPTLKQGVETNLTKAQEELKAANILSEGEELSDKEIKEIADKQVESFSKRVRSNLPEFKSIIPYIKPIAKALPLAGAYSSWSEAREAGMDIPKAAAYTAFEELVNPTPLSALDAKAGLEGLVGLIKEKLYTGDRDSMFPSPEAQGEKMFLENYKNSAAAKAKEEFQKRKKDEELLNSYVEQIPENRKIIGSEFNPDIEDWDYKYDPEINKDYRDFMDNLNSIEQMAKPEQFRKLRSSLKAIKSK